MSTSSASHLPKGRNCETCDTRSESIFCNLPKEALDIINKSKIISHYRRGQYVFYRENLPPGLYCVSSGVVKLEVEGPTGNGHILRVVQGGVSFGLPLTFFGGNLRKSLAVVQDDSTICLIPKAAVTELLSKYSFVAMRRLAQVSRELRSAEARFCAQTDKRS